MSHDWPHSSCCHNINNDDKLAVSWTHWPSARRASNRVQSSNGYTNLEHLLAIIVIVFCTIFWIVKACTLVSHGKDY